MYKETTIPVQMGWLQRTTVLGLWGRGEGLSSYCLLKTASLIFSSSAHLEMERRIFQKEKVSKYLRLEGNVLFSFIL